jgi:hypothetical protein
MDDVSLGSLFQKEFEWCRLAPGESAAIVTEPASPSSYLAASLASLAGRGARPFQVMLPLTPTADDIAVVAQDQARPPSWSTSPMWWICSASATSSSI